MPLTIESIESAKPGVNAKGEATDKPYKLGDSGGLFVLVQPNGGKWWRFKYRFAGKENRVSLGRYPEVPLSDAREQRDTLRALVADGIDPSAHLKAERAAKRAEDERLRVETRFMLDNNGALSFRFGNRHVSLSATETTELRAFLDATKDVKPKVTPCP